MGRRRFDHLHSELSVAVGRLVSRYALWLQLRELGWDPEGLSRSQAVVFPVALPLAYALNPDPLYVQLCFGAVLGGAVFGDQCSPISDTTILSSMFTGCDLMDHVRTQLPLALSAAAVAALFSTVAAALV